jgi:hypothetical protein
MIISQLKLFLDSKHRNLWIQDDYMSVYVRKAKRFLDKSFLTTLDIASVEVEESKRNCGLWSNFLRQSHEINPYQATYVESVLNPILFESLSKHGWIIAGENNFYMKTEKCVTC